MGVGKTTAVKAFGELQKVHCVKFAQPLYDMQEYIYGRISSVVKRQSDFMKDRKLLQWLGTDWGRDTISPTIWVDIWKAEVNSYLAQGATVVCDDVRFDNEAQTVLDMGGTVLKIVSEDTENRIDTKSGLVQHKSELGVSSNLVSHTIVNNGTLEQFKDSLFRFFLMKGNG